MGIFNFLKKKEVKVVDLSFEEAGGRLEEMKKLSRTREIEVLSRVTKMLDGFYDSVEDKLGVLESVDIESKKEYERVKLLVRQGLDKYIYSVRGLLEELRALERDEIGKFVREVGEIFIGFEKKSFKVYERATYLIGDEMMAVKNEIRKFYNGLVEIFEKEKGLIGNLNVVKDVRLKLGEIEKFEIDLREIEREIEENNVWINNERRKIRKFSEEVEETKKSSEYVSNLRLKDEVGRLEKKLGAEIVRLRGLIDFKKLVGIVHVNEREFGIVKKYRDSFVSEFSRNGEKLVDLLKGAGMMSSDIKRQVALISKLRDELVGAKKKVVVDIVVGKLEEIRKIEGRIEEMRIEDVKIRHRMKELGEKLEETKEAVVELGKCF
ncbi:MAG: hypothetical protein KJ592_00455 [Nanoarchaeota archaeon]|nr:hypothetical protein [Nanoarchaeota archaeon]